MPHCYAVIDCDGVELATDGTCLPDGLRDKLSHVAQVDVTRNELGKGVRDRDDGFAEIGVSNARGAPECAGAGHVSAVSGRAGTKRGHVSPSCVEPAQSRRFRGRDH